MDAIGLVSGGSEKGFSLPSMPEPPQPAGASFSDVLHSSLERVQRLQAEADTAVEDLTLGRQTDIHSTMVAAELALQIRNKLLNAYETLMRQQI